MFPLIGLPPATVFMLSIPVSLYFFLSTKWPSLHRESMTKAPFFPTSKEDLNLQGPNHEIRSQAKRPAPASACAVRPLSAHTVFFASIKNHSNVSVLRDYQDLCPM